MKINEIGEFGLIGRIADAFQPLVPNGWEGIGDDCAVIPWSDNHSLLVTTDLLVENVHFLRNRISAYELGLKSLAVNLSDVAAMGGEPVATFLSLGLPADTVTTEWSDAFFEGYRSFGVPLLGGDTTSSREGIVINITVLGRAENSHIKRRSAAQAGDWIAVTGPLGDSAGGLQALLQSLPPEADTSELVRRHHRPRPHLAEGLWLGGRTEVHAMMDVSDGVASDLQHILRASSLAATVSVPELPITPLLQRVAAQYGWDAARMALTGGEDYVLLLTVSDAGLEELQAAYTARFGSPLHLIGRCENGPSGTIRYLGSEAQFTGFKHF